MESNLLLRPLQSSDEKSFRNAVEEFQTIEPNWDFAFYFDSTMPFTQYVNRLSGWPKGVDLPPKFVHNTFLVGVINDQIVGRVSLRHELNEFLAKVGGHVGYGVVPSHRMKGYATEMLRQTLPIAKSLGLNRLLVTCDDDNIGSIKTIENCNGIFEGFCDDISLPKRKRRYWIELT